MNRNKPMIVCAAIRVVMDVGSVNFSHLLIGARHWDKQMLDQFSNIPYNLCVKIEKECQGFIDQFGTFYDRKQALKIAKQNNQIRHELSYKTNELFSEMLY